MQAADVLDLDDCAAGRRLFRPRDGRILLRGEVRSPFVIVGEVLLEVAAQRALVPHDDVVEALAAQGTDHALHERILPGKTRRRHHFDAHGLRDLQERRAVDRIAFSDDESRRGVPRPRLAELLHGPRRRRVRRDV
jgi:hypothetical protein